MRSALRSLTPDSTTHDSYSDATLPRPARPDAPTSCAHLLDRGRPAQGGPRAAGRRPPLRGRVVGLVFEKPSLRTRVSFEAAMAQLGGTSLFLPGNEVGLGWRETRRRLRPHHRASTSMRWCCASFKHDDASTELAAHATRARSSTACPTWSHPCQALADLLTIREAFGDVDGPDGRLRRRRQQRGPVAGGRLRQARGALRAGVRRRATASTTRSCRRYAPDVPHGDCWSRRHDPAARGRRART